jgi:hypothetical protein
MEIKTANDGITLSHIKFQGEWKQVSDVEIKDIPEITKHAEYMEKLFRERAGDVWTRDEAHAYIRSSNRNQQKTFKILLTNTSLLSKDLALKLGLEQNQISGVMSGLARRHKSRYLGKEELLQTRWTEHGMCRYSLNPDYKEWVKEYFDEATHISTL